MSPSDLLTANIIINPNAEEREISEMAVTVAPQISLLLWIEAGANEIDNKTMYDGIMFAHKENQKIVKFIKKIQKSVGKKKLTSLK